MLESVEDATKFPFVMRFADDRSVVTIEIQKAHSRQWNPNEKNIVSKTTATQFTPRFSDPVEVGETIAVDASDGIEFFQVMGEPKIRPEPNSIYVKRIPAPENVQDLLDQGKLVYPANSQVLAT